ncbi:hypothetical protein K505DRAFT_338303 [Melanomma pulvis-pyrius CBS 109.77]|uniref:Uncharacterized protein n=1 Tax=Melanomma pulvis-pyrius CBS 109.77 TaxID=1314802 RepID=A0A6A6XAQ5_9PLEO|nr:hypothetical protein K505DRAFT_338303 [Melanomma pulvis-pyrius CBS 109.77]
MPYHAEGGNFSSQSERRYHERREHPRRRGPTSREKNPCPRYEYSGTAREHQDYYEEDERYDQGKYYNERDERYRSQSRDSYSKDQYEKPHKYTDDDTNEIIAQNCVGRFLLICMLLRKRALMMY